MSNYDYRPELEELEDLEELERQKINNPKEEENDSDTDDRESSPY